MLGFALLAGVVSIFAALGTEEQRLTIAVKQGVESIALKEIARRFSQDQHVTVQVIEFPYEQLYNEEQKQLLYRPKRLRDSVPPFDVIMVDDPWLYSLVADQYNPTVHRLEDLTFIIKPSEGQFFDATLCVSAYDPGRDCKDYSSWRSTAHYYAVPFVANSQLFAYRVSDFKNLNKPTTWENVLLASQAIQKQGSVGYVNRIGPGNSIVTDFMPILWAYDPLSFPEGPRGGAVLHDPKSALQELTQLVATRKNLGSASFDDFDVAAYLQSGHASMGIVWSAWAMAMVRIDDSVAGELFRQSKSPASMSERVERLSQSLLTKSENPAETYFSANKLKEDLVFDKVPVGPGGQAEPELGVWMFGIPTDQGKKIEQYENALKFIKYATDLNDDQQTQSYPQGLLAAELGTPPARKTAWADPQLQERFGAKHPSLIPAIEWSLTHARPRPRTACWKEVESRLGTYLERLVDNSVQLGDVPESANTELQPFFNEARCMEFLRSQQSR